MKTQKTNLLLTGDAGVGKTTALKRVVIGLREKDATGFLTRELLVRGRRVGFQLVSLKRRTAMLANINLRTAKRVGNYGVDLAALDQFVERELAPRDTPALYIIDDISPITCLSGRFVDAVSKLLDSRATVVASVAQNGPGFIAQAKERKDAEIWQVLDGNRDELPRRVLTWIEMHGFGVSV